MIPMTSTQRFADLKFRKKVSIDIESLFCNSRVEVFAREAKLNVNVFITANT